MSIPILPRSIHRFPFEFRLAESTLPCSFESRIGTVRYYLRVLIDIPICLPTPGTQVFYTHWASYRLHGWEILGKWCYHYFLKIVDTLTLENVTGSLVMVSSGTITFKNVTVQRLQKLISLHLCTDCFMKISLQSSEQIIFMKKSVNNCREINFCNLCA